MAEEKIWEKPVRRPGLMDNITEYDVGTGRKFQITLGKRAGFGEDETNHSYITLPAASTSDETLMHINNAVHNAIHRARQQEREDLRKEFQILLGLRKRYE